jgi:hypothetical protein
MQVKAEFYWRCFEFEGDPRAQRAAADKFILEIKQFLPEIDATIREEIGHLVVDTWLPSTRDTDSDMTFIWLTTNRMATFEGPTN